MHRRYCRTQCCWCRTDCRLGGKLSRRSHGCGYRYHRRHGSKGRQVVEQGHGVGQVDGRVGVPPCVVFGHGGFEQENHGALRLVEAVGAKAAYHVAVGDPLAELAQPAPLLGEEQLDNSAQRGAAVPAGPVRLCRYPSACPIVVPPVSSSVARIRADSGRRDGLLQGSWGGVAGGGRRRAG